MDFRAIFKNKSCKLVKKNVGRQKSVEFTSIFLSKIFKMEKKREQTEVGFLLY